jgi:hypothetical protein
MTPPLCPLCGKRASERTAFVKSELTGYPPVMVVCASPFHDAGDWGPELLEALREARDEILVSAGDEAIVTTIDGLCAAVEGKEDGK